MQVAVHLVEEVACAAVKDDVHARLDKVGHVDHGVVLPVLRMLLDGSEALCYVPAIVAMKIARVFERPVEEIFSLEEGD